MRDCVCVFFCLQLLQYCGASGCNNTISIQATAAASAPDYARLATQSVVDAINNDACAINACVMVHQACATCDVVSATGVDETAQAAAGGGLSRGAVAVIVVVCLAVGGIIAVALHVYKVRGDSSRVGAYSAAAGWLQQTGWLQKAATVAPAPALGLADTDKVQQQCLQGGGPGLPGLHDATAVVGVTSCAEPAPSRAVEVQKCTPHHHPASTIG
jgi:hypothetical protein